MSASEPLKTPLYDWHRSNGGRMVEFGGWSMPVQYTSVVEEHQAVRTRLGLFDISHMGRLWVDGPDALASLELATTNEVKKLVPGKVQYSLLTNDAGGVIDDILVYRTAESFLVVCNASNRPRVVEELSRLFRGRSVALRDDTLATAMIAVQGPSSVATTQSIFEGHSPLAALGYYQVMQGECLGVATWASRTGYTGEDGIELIVPADRAQEVWEKLLDSGSARGVVPCGLGARDTLRFEAGMPLYGHEMDESVNPYAAGLGWAVKLSKGDFRGRSALVACKANPGRKRVGLELLGKRIARQGAVVLAGDRPIGAVTSGTFSPTLGKSLAMALIELDFDPGAAPLQVDVRGRPEAAVVVPLPFYRRPGHAA